MAATTDVRNAIAQSIANALGLDVVAGKLEGPLREVSIACVWPDGQSPVEGDANYVEYRLIARVLLALDPHVSELEPDDPTGLEDVAEAVAVTLASEARSGSLVETFVTVHGAEYDVDANSVDVLISAQIPNPYDPG